jgi:serine/threonine protein kinase/tetratricopeptide (TPR) repeat protein
MIGETIAHYRIIEMIGLGGGGEVYLARDTSLERLVALKFLAQGSQSDRHARKRFMTEARAAAAIDHPYICKIFEIGKSDNRLYIVMEYVKGETLREALIKSSMPVKQRLRIALEIAEALRTAHAKGVVHRDLKPANIILTADGHIKVMDFGLAKRLPVDEITIDRDQTTTMTGVAVGTPAYMSPEQAECRQVDSRSDIFSLGIILYEMLTGCHPFRKEVPVLTMMAIMSETPEPLSSSWPECPGALARIVERMLEKDAALRYQSIGDAHTDLSELADSFEVSGTVAQPPVRSIAVLPFANLSTEQEKGYFSDGITEEIILQLNRISGLKVISRSSVMQYRCSDLDLDTIGKQLMVDALLEGSVRWAGNRMRVSCELFDTRSRKHVWTDAYNLVVEDELGTQEEVADKIVTALEGSLGGQEERTPASDLPRSLDAYQCFVKGRYYLHRASAADLQKAIERFEAALEINPGYARGHAGLSICFAYAGHQGYLQVAETFPKVRTAALRAVELDDGLAEARISMALLKLFHDWDFEGASAELQRAKELNPSSAEGYLLSSWYGAARGRFTDAVADARRAVELDPLSLMASLNLGWTLMYASQLDPAIKVLDKILALNPDLAVARLCLATVMLQVDRGDEALAIIERYAWCRGQLAQGYAMAGQRRQARDLVEEIVASRSSEHDSAYDIGLTYLLLGDLEPGIDWLQEARGERDSRLLFLKHAPSLGHLQVPQLDTFYLK